MTHTKQGFIAAAGTQTPSGGDGAVARSFQYCAGQGWAAPLDPSLNSSATLVLAFGAARFAGEPGLFQELRQAFPESQIVGCSTAGEILGSRLFDDSVAVAVMKFSRPRVAVATAPVSSTRESRAAGRRLAEQLSRPGLAGLLVFSDGLNVNG